MGRGCECKRLLMTTMGVDFLRSFKRYIAVMLLDASRVLRIEIVLPLMFLPLLIWLALYLAARTWSVNCRPALPWLRALRWIGWALGVVLLTLSLVRDHFSWYYGIAMGTFSIGLNIPESWIKRRFAPELLEPERDWWHSKS